MTMARWQATIVDEAGNVQGSASVEVRGETSGSPLASIYSDRDGVTPLGNPFSSDGEGFAAFHVVGGAYRITATKGAFSRVWRYVGIGTAQEADATEGEVTGPDGGVVAGQIVIFGNTSGSLIEGAEDDESPAGPFTMSDLLALTATGQGIHTIVIPAGAMVPATTSGAAAAKLESTTNDVTYNVLDFDDAADEYAHFNIAMPKSWNESTVTFRAFWTSTATGTTGVAWGLQGIALSDNEAIDTAFGTPVVVTDDAQSAAGELYVTTTSGAITIGGTPAEGDLVFFRVFRDVSDANDDMTEDARLIAIQLFFTTNAATDD